MLIVKVGKFSYQENKSPIIPKLQDNNSTYLGAFLFSLVMRALSVLPVFLLCYLSLFFLICDFSLYVLFFSSFTEL